jgi:hypothetical protein
MGNLLKAPHVPSDGVREALGIHLGRPRPWAGLGKGIRFKNKPCSPPHADSGYAAISSMRPTAVSKKSGIFWPRAPRHGQPRRRGNNGALAIPGPTVVECMLILGIIVFDWGCEAF